VPLPQSLPWMESVDAKLLRAHEHLGALESAISEYHRGTKRTLILKLNPEQTTVKLMTWVDDPYPPIRISTLIGDCVFNARAALDNLICGLVRIQRPASTCGGRRFPIVASVDDWDKSTSSLRGVPSEAKRIVKAVQPFNRPKGSELIDPLNILNTLRNRDTHRAVLLTSGYSKNTRFAIHTNEGKVLYVTSDRPLFGEGFDEIPLAIPPASVIPDARVEAVGTTVLAFREDGPWSDRAVLDVLTTCVRYVEDSVIMKFRPFFVPHH
jgi:hypothetical protein